MPMEDFDSRCTNPRAEARSSHVEASAFSRDMIMIADSTVVVHTGLSSYIILREISTPPLSRWR